MDVNIVCVALFCFSGIEAQIKRLPRPVTERGGFQRPPSMAILNTPMTLDSFGLLDPLFSSTANSKYRWRKKYPDSREKRLYRQNSPDSKVFALDVSTLDSGFKISGNKTKPECFHFGFVLLCVNGKTHPVLKRSGFITNPEQFALV